jgi:hypothetical protein
VREAITRAMSCSNVWDQAGAETLRGLFCPVSCFGAVFGEDQTRTDRYSGTPVGLASDRRVCEACEGRLGEASVKVFAGVPWKGKTQGRLQRLAG